MPATAWTPRREAASALGPHAGSLRSELLASSRRSSPHGSEIEPLSDRAFARGACACARRSPSPATMGLRAREGAPAPRVSERALAARPQPRGSRPRVGRPERWTSRTPRGIRPPPSGARSRQRVGILGRRPPWLSASSDRQRSPRRVPPRARRRRARGGVRVRRPLGETWSRGTTRSAQRLSRPLGATKAIDPWRAHFGSPPVDGGAWSRAAFCTAGDRSCHNRAPLRWPGASRK
jgi:hypothetical protein